MEAGRSWGAGSGESPSTTRGATTTRRRFITTKGATAAVLPLLAACGAPGEAPPGQQSTQPATVLFQHRWEGAREPLVQAQVTAFQQLNPKIKIDNQLVFCQGDSCPGGMPYDKILAQISAGTPPDLFMVSSDRAHDFDSQSALLHLEALAKRDKLDLPNVFYPALVKMGSRRGSVIGFPQLSAGDPPYLFMGQQVLQDAGLDTSKPPQSWDDFVSASQKITKRGEGPGGFERIGWNPLYSHTSSFVFMLHRNNGKIFDEDATKVLFNSQEGLDTLTWMQQSFSGLFGTFDALNAFNSGVKGQGSTADRVPHYNGKIGMWLDGVWHFGWIKGEAAQFNPQFKSDVAIAPYNARNAQAKPLSLATGVWLYAIPKGAPHVDASFEWMKYITMGEGNRTFVKAQDRPSPAIKINDDPDFVKGNPNWDLVKKGLTLMTPLPQTSAWTKIYGEALRRDTPLGRISLEVWSGERGPREALEAAAREAQQYLDEANRRR
jgi:multiple sugar transport system substrate-binding protein